MDGMYRFPLYSTGLCPLRFPPGPLPCLPNSHHHEMMQQGKGTDDHLLPLGNFLPYFLPFPPISSFHHPLITPFLYLPLISSSYHPFPPLTTPFLHFGPPPFLFPSISSIYHPLTLSTTNFLHLSPISSTYHPFPPLTTPFLHFGPPSSLFPSTSSTYHPFLPSFHPFPPLPFLGCDPEGGRSPVEHRGNLCVRPYVRPSVFPSPPPVTPQRQPQASQRLV